ncbi:MAG: polysaccharide biosynthesis/export family protein [Candidatus Omnitrophota bacterium]
MAKAKDKIGARRHFLKLAPGVILLFFLCGCQTIPVKKVSDNSNTPVLPQEQGYINEAEIVYAADIQDRGWELKDYSMETGDVLNISVWQVEDLQKTVVVRPDGKISFPLIGDIQAKDVTIENLRLALEEKLGKYIRVPQVSVIIETFGGKRAIVIDEAGGGGIIRFAEPIRAIEALAMAGGYSSDVNLHKIYIIRGGMEKGKPSQIIIADAHKIFREGDMSQNILIQSDDIIFLARGWLSTLTNFVGQMDALKNQIGNVVTQANYYRNMDNVMPWNYKTTDVDLRKGDFVKGDWDTGTQ